MIDIDKAFEEFIEFPEGSRGKYVTTASAKFFAEYCVEKLKAEAERLQAQLNAAKRGMDSAKAAGALMMEKGQQLAAENSPEAIESEREANAVLTAENEQLQAEVERLRAYTSDTDQWARKLEHTVLEISEECNQLKAETKRLDADVVEEISNRDRVEAHADRLADGIAKALGVDIGEHSSANCPWNNAFFAIDEFDLARHDAEAIRVAIAKTRTSFNQGGNAWLCRVDDLEAYANRLIQQAREVRPERDSCELECGAYGTYCRCRAEKAKEVHSGGN